MPGLATEADTAEILVRKLRTLIPELLAANDGLLNLPIAFELLTRCFGSAAL